MGECRCDKEHSLIEISASYNFLNMRGVSVKWCDVCGYIIKKELVWKDGNWGEEKKTEWTPQIAEEVLAAEKTEAEQTQLAYDKIFYIDDQCLGQ